MPLLKSEALEELKQYKSYQKNPSPSFPENILHFVCGLVSKLIPNNISPNVITLIGFILISWSYTLMIPYDINFRKNMPPRLVFTVAVFQFCHQIFNVLSEKQATKFDSLKPLWILFYQVCNSLSLGFFVLDTLQVLKFWDDTATTCQLFLTIMIISWLTLWSEYHTKTPFSGIGEFGMIQMQCLGALFLTVMAGQSLWVKPTMDFIPAPIQKILPNYPVIKKIYSIPIRLTLLHLLIASATLASIGMILKTLKASTQKVKALGQLLSISLLSALVIIWLRTPFYASYRGPVLLIFGLYFALMNCKLILAAMTKTEFYVFHREIIALGIFTLLLFRDKIFPKFKLPFREHKVLLALLIVLTIIFVVGWILRVIKEASNYLGVSCFSTKTRSDPKANGSNPATKREKVTHEESKGVSTR